MYCYNIYIIQLNQKEIKSIEFEEWDWLFSLGRQLIVFIVGYEPEAPLAQPHSIQFNFIKFHCGAFAFCCWLKKERARSLNVFSSLLWLMGWFLRRGRKRMEPKLMKWNEAWWSWVEWNSVAAEGWSPAITHKSSTMKAGQTKTKLYFSSFAPFVFSFCLHLVDWFMEEK